MGEYQSDKQEFISPILKKTMLNLPERSSNALSGTEFGQKIYNMPPNEKRDQVICEEILSGNVPDFLRTFRPITVVDKGKTIQYYCSPDYLSVGNSDDYLRITMGAKSIKKLFDELGVSLPTKKMVDQIWISADLKLNAIPMAPTPAMVLSPALIEHNKIIQKQINGKQFDLVAGIKKDVVIGKPLLTYKNKIGIYGWFLNGKPIQGPNPNYTSHQSEYCDYSQCLRLINRNIILQDQPNDLYEALKDNSSSYLISEEGNYDPSSIYT